MKGLKKIALVSAIAAASAGAQAELKALDDSAMGELTGQAGLTIDIETEWTIGEFAYHDAGVVVLKDLSMGGNSNEGTNTMLDNIRLTLDVAGPGGESAFAYGMSEAKGLAAVHYKALTDAGMAPTDQIVAEFGAAAQGNGNQNGVAIDVVTGHRIDDERTAGDGDLVLHFGFTDAWQKSAAGSFAGFFNPANAATIATTTYADARDIATRAVDFEFNIGQIALADSGYVSDGRLGEEVINKTDHVSGLDNDTTTGETTTLISDLSMKGYLGPMDILIQNNGNGFGNGAGRGDADSKIQWDSFFKVTDLDLYIDIAGVQLTDIKIHNVRGDLTSLNTVTYDASGTPTTVNTSAFGFAHSKREIFAVKDAVLNLHDLAAGGTGYVDGIAINTTFKGDIDIGALSFGNTGTSIGSIYLTDIESTTNWTISAH